MGAVQNFAGTAADLHKVLSLPSDESFTMRCRKNLHDA
jgi:hypothetical protein